MQLIEMAKQKMRPTAADLQEIRRIRHEVRCAEGEGGQCGFVAEIIMNRFRWPMHGGTYCNDIDEPICNDHVWNVLPDGTILDATADQMGLGHDIRIVEPSDPDFRKYRFEWNDDYHPDSEDYPELKGVKWSGKFDTDWADELRQERGRDWHVTDPEQYARYQQQVAAYRAGQADPKKPF
jgi:hypothetical protein